MRPFQIDINAASTVADSDQGIIFQARDHDLVGHRRAQTDTSVLKMAPSRLITVTGVLGLLAQGVIAESAEAQTDSPFAVSGKAVADVIGPVSGGDAQGARYLQDVEAVVDTDLDRLVRWQGATMRIHLLSTAGGRPNDLAGTLQGVDNIEVGRSRTKLYQAWLEQAFAGGAMSLRVGLTDLNAEFYQNDSAGLLIAPAFGIGSELAATGPNGPSIFPSTALTARLHVAPSKNTYVRAAIVNARAGTLGDPGGVDIAMTNGALAIVEAGWTTNGKIALGYWRYTRDQPDLLAAMVSGQDRGRPSQGVYLLFDRSVRDGGDNAMSVDAFTRIGISDGETTPYKGGLQAGLLASNVVRGRPDSQISVGVNSGFLASRFRTASRLGGTRYLGAETAFEVTYSDRIHRLVTLQPDFQVINRAIDDGDGKPVIVIGLRVVIASPG